MTAVSWTIIALMVALNAVFAAYEIALASISAARLKAFADEHRPGARTALWMKQNLEASLAVVQVGITFVGAIAAATGGARAAEGIDSWIEALLGVRPWLATLLAMTLVVVPLGVVTIVVGELMPKLFALKNKEWVCLRLSPLMYVLSIVAYPAVWLLEQTVTLLLEWSERRWQPKVDGQRAEVTEMQELRAIVALARTSRLIGGQEEKIILGAARLANRPISEIMIPTAEIITLDLQHTMAECLVIAHTDMHTRFPVCARPGDAQSICGYVNFKDIVSELRLAPDQPSLRGIMRPIPEYAATDSIGTILERMIQGHVHIATVRDTGGRLVGMVTLEDILEELVGDIRDEYDRAPTVLVPSGSGWLVGGGVALERIEAVTATKIDRSALPAEAHTLHDWVRGVLGRPVRGGDIVRHSGLRVVVRKIRRQQVQEAQLSLEPVVGPRSQDPAQRGAPVA